MNQPVIETPTGRRTDNDKLQVNDLAAQFARENRIHIEDGSLFTGDHYLMVHPGEMAPENQQRLFTKIVKHYALPSPSFFMYYPRNSVMYSLASYLPISATARLKSLQEATEKLKTYTQTGIHPDSDEQIQQYDNPLAAFAKSQLEEPEIDPINQEYLTNATALYLVVNEGLKQTGRFKEAATYVKYANSPDSITADIVGRLNVDFATFVQTAQTQGLDGVAQLLNVPPQTLQEIKQVSEMASQHEYADNLILNWDVGRHVPGMQERSIEEKIAVGILQRAGAKLQQLHQIFPAEQPTPSDIATHEQHVTAMMRELPQPLQEAIYYSGTELGFTRGPGLGQIDPSMERALGVHLHIPFEYGGHDGLRHILTSNLDHVKECRRTFHHEAHHLFFPKQLTKDSLQTIDTLMKHGTDRLSKLKSALDTWKLETDPKRQAMIEQQIDQAFSVGNIGLSEALSRNGPNAVSMDSLRGWVDHALHNFDPHSLRLSKGYPTPELRAAEILSRFSELHYVDLPDNPALLGFIAPELMVVYHDHYLPHIEKQVETFKSEQAQLPANLRFLGLPAGMALPQTQQQTLSIQQVAPAKPTDIAAKTPDSVIQSQTAIAPDIAQAAQNHGALSYLQKLQNSHQIDLASGTGNSPIR